MKALISGGLGFIGSRLARRLAERGTDIVILDNALPQVHADPLGAIAAAKRFATVIRGDVRDRTAWRDALAGCDLVLHMAAETGTGQSMDEIARYCEVNVTGTAVLAEELRDSRVAKVFLPSSRAIYGEGAYRCERHGVVNGTPRRREDLALGRFDVACGSCGAVATPVATPETLPPKPASIYASTKLMQELILQQCCEYRGIDLRIARYQNVYGPGQALRNPYTGVLAILAEKIAAGETLDIFEDGTISRDFVFIDDVVELSLRLIDRPDAIEGAVNVGTGKPCSLVDVVRAYESVIERAVPFEITGHFRFGDIRHAWADTTKLTKLLGNVTFAGIEEGLRRLVTWQKSQAGQPTVP